MLRKQLGNKKTRWQIILYLVARIADWHNIGRGPCSEGRTREEDWTPYSRNEKWAGRWETPGLVGEPACATPEARTAPVAWQCHGKPFCPLLMDRKFSFSTYPCNVMNNKSCYMNDTDPCPVLSLSCIRCHWCSFTQWKLQQISIQLNFGHRVPRKFPWSKQPTNFHSLLRGLTYFIGIFVRQPSICVLQLSRKRAK